MHPGDVICNAILARDIDRGLDYAIRSLPHTFDRMKYGKKTTEAYLKRLTHITVGKCAEAAIVRFLRAHGVSHSSIEGITPHTEHDRFDLRIGHEVVDIKSFRLPEKYAKAEFLVNALALVANHYRQDQWSQRQHYHRYVFAFFAGQFVLTLQQGLSALLNPDRLPPKDDIIITRRDPRIFLTAAPSISECEEKFHRIPKGTKCLQYPRGTRVENMGCWIHELTAFRKVVDWGGV